MRIAHELMERHLNRQEEKTLLRTQKINALIEEAKKSGGVTDRTYWTMVYDFELSPKTTNRQQLLELGIEMPEFDSVPCSTTRLGILKSVVAGLSLLNIFLIRFECFTDDELYWGLERVIDEQVHEMVGEGVREFIEFPTSHASDPEAVHTRDWIPEAQPIEAKNPQR